MTALVPSNVAKVARAEKHLIDLKEAIIKFGGQPGSRPYEVAHRMQGKRNVYRLRFTQSPANTDIPIILADGLYNLRSALDHLLCSLHPAKNRSSIMFPVFFQGVWEEAVEGENEQRTKERGRWLTCTKGLSDDAIAFLKSCQPPDDAGKPNEATDFLRDLNKLVNRDRHEKLPVIAPGLRDAVIRWTKPDGTVQTALALIGDNSMAEDNAEIGRGVIPKDAMNVEIEGTPVVVIDVGQKDAYRVLPDFVETGITMLREVVIPRLGPHVRPVGGKKGR